MPSPTTLPGCSRSALRPEVWGQIWAEDIPLSPKKVCPHRASCVLGPLRDQMWEERGSHLLPTRKLTKAEKGGEGQGRGVASHGPQQSR